jgi:hypothetical protein
VGRRQLAGALALIALALACGTRQDTAPPPAAPKTDDAYVREFLTTWLVRRDFDGVRKYLAPDFFISKIYGGNAEQDRMIRFPATCQNAPARCNSLDDCVRGIERGAAGYKIETITIAAGGRTDQMPELRSREGKKMLAVSFTLKGCNLGTMVFIDADAHDERRVVTIVYVAS